MCKFLLVLLRSTAGFGAVHETHVLSLCAQAIKDLLTKRFQDVERTFHDLDESNTRRLTQEMMYQLLKR